MIRKSLFGTTILGEKVYKYDLVSNTASASILTFGATLQSLNVLSKHGAIDVVLGYDDLPSYEKHDSYLGATVGRNCNRVKNAEFTLNGTLIKLNKNDGAHNLHGGNVGFSHRVWQVKDVDENGLSLTLSIFSPNGEENFPANVEVSVKYTLKESELIIEYFGTTDAPTVLNLTNHSYFCLDGEGASTAHDAYFKINADYTTEVDSGLIPTGRLNAVKNTPFDFTEFKQIKKDILSNDKQIEYMHGYDCNFCLNNNGNYQEVATAYSNNSGVKLSVFTNNCGLQLYTGYFLTERVGKGGKIYGQNRSICLETQTYPDAVNNPNFPTSILNPNETYHVKTAYAFSVIKD